MQSFKQYLMEENTMQLTTSVAIKELFRHHKFSVSNTVSDYQVLKDGTVNVKKQLCHFRWFESAAKNTNLDASRLPFKFKLGSDNFTIHSDCITDIVGAPVKGGYFSIKAQKLKSLTGLEAEYTDLAIYCEELTEFNCKIKTDYVFISIMKSFNAKDFANSFSKADKKVNINFGLNAASQLLYKTPLLSLLKNKDFGHITFVNMEETTNPKLIEVRTVCEILNKSKGNLIAAQEELFKNDLDEYAKL